MCSLLARRIFSPSPFHIFHQSLTPLSPFLGRYLSHQSQQDNELPFMAQYLVSSFGFSRDRAIKISADHRLTPIKSPDRPEAVVQFLKEIGLSDTLVKGTISFHPYLLAYNVEKTLKPRACELMDAGFSKELLAKMIRFNPNSLLLKKTLPRFLCWNHFVGNSDESFIKLFQRNRLIIMCDIDKRIVPKMNLLKEYEFSHQDIVGLILRKTIISRNFNACRQLLEQTEELGLKRGCAMFLRAIKELGDCRIETMKRNAEFYHMAYGWTKEDLCSAFRRFPAILRLSMYKIKLNMNFLIREAKLEPRSIASQPILLGYSVEKRLIPRHKVVSILAAKGLKKYGSILTICACSEKIFFKRYIEPYKRDVPELADAYFAALGRSITVPV